MPGSKKGQSVLDANRKVSHGDLSVNCNDVSDVKHDMVDGTVSPSRDNRNIKLPRFEPRCFDGNPADYLQFVKEFEIMLSGFLLNDELKLMYLMRYCTGDAARAIQCCKFMKPKEGYDEAMSILRQRFGRPSMIAGKLFEAVKGNGGQLQDDSQALTEFLDNLLIYKNGMISMNRMSDLNSSFILEVIARRLPTRLQRKWVKISSRMEDEGIEPKFDDILKLVNTSVNQSMSKFASLLDLTPRIEQSEGKTHSLMTSRPQRGGYRESSMMSSNAYRPSECNRFRNTSSTDKLQDARQTRFCFTRVQEVHTEVNCEPVSKFSDKLSVNSRPYSELCDDNVVVKKSVVATGKPLLNRVSQNRVTASEWSSDSKSLQSITSQSEDVKPLMICEEEPKLSTSVIKEFENDELDGKLDICDNDHDSADLSLVDHYEMRDMPTTAKLNKGSVQLQREVELNADAVPEGVHTCETVSVIDQRVAHLSSDDSAKPELVVKDSSGGNLAVGQLSESRKRTASDPPLSSSPCVNQSSLVLSSAVRQTPINSSILCNDYGSISSFERTNINGQFSVDKPSVKERVIVKLTCTNKGISSFKSLFECYYLWCKLLCFYTWLMRYGVCMLVMYILRYNDMSGLPFRFEDIADRRKLANELCDDFPT
uniref:Uncharacterized protein n=1 Tax=Trichobilharzia regenti TaxID=157069 RepID=A0AA85JRS2_TRIRE|nr:unnamed protein product [Trichobilharzia regenti]CAH8830851.1 unnamed protein product [Trichobilharzia regenti]CAH8857272.1 unnamed protein product [Trichobilharzia regenti]CAH8869630.1 unnamed protein product [Trichobilharzia regenti]CAH8870040.1 unnamed protein product [Trichobilharzia regenti]